MLKSICEARAYFRGVDAQRQLVLQRGRRRLRLQTLRAAWRCQVCGGPATPYVKKLKRQTCSARCKADWTADLQRERRLSQMVGRLLDQLSEGAHA